MEVGVAVQRKSRGPTKEGDKDGTEVTSVSVGSLWGSGTWWGPVGPVGPEPAGTVDRNTDTQTRILETYVPGVPDVRKPVVLRVRCTGPVMDSHLSPEYGVGDTQR